MILAAEYTPSPLPLMLVTQEIGFPIPSPPVFPVNGDHNFPFPDSPESRNGGGGELETENPRFPIPDSTANGKRGPGGGGPGIQARSRTADSESELCKASGPFKLAHWQQAGPFRQRPPVKPGKRH
jgi:hypothetical protein